MSRSQRDKDENSAYIERQAHVGIGRVPTGTQPPDSSQRQAEACGARMANASGTRATVLLETINPLDLTPDDLQELTDLLSREAPQLSFQVAYDDQHGGGVSWHEVLRIWLPNADFIKDAIYTIILTESFASMRRRFQRKHSSRRPKSIVVHDMQTGKELASFVIDDADAEPQSQVLEVVPRKVPHGRHRRG